MQSLPMKASSKRKMIDKRKLCCIFNVAPHYRKAIYKMMDENLNCDFYIGDRVNTPLETMKYESLDGFKNLLIFKNIWGDFYWQKGVLNTFFKPYKKYVITGEPYCLSTWVILLLSKLGGKKTYLWTHGWYGNEGKMKTTVKKLFFGLSTEIFLYGNHARNLMIQEGFDKEKLHLIYNSLDYKRQLDIRQKIILPNVYRKHFRNDYPVLIFTGRLNKVKKLDLLIKAHHLLNKEGINLNVLILGDGEERSNLEQMVKVHNLSNNYWFYGACYDEELLGRFYHEATVCISPGNVGLTGIHALTYGCPVITHNNFEQQMPEFEVIQESKTGSFFIENDIQDLGAKILYWIDKSPSEEIRKDCYEIIDKFYNPDYQIKILQTVLTNK